MNTVQEEAGAMIAHRCELVAVAALGASIATLGWLAGRASEAGRLRPSVLISLAGATLRLDEPAPAGRGPGRVGGEPTRRRRAFPVGVGRHAPEGLASPVGLLHTGSDPRDRRFYDPARREPAIYGGLPFIRLDRPTRRRHRGQPVRPYSVHGPVTPSLIWGQISAGCVRMRASHLGALYRVALAHPRMRVQITRDHDRPALRQGIVADGPRIDRCPEASQGVRRLLDLGSASDETIHDRVCGGVDHWYALTLQGGQLLSVQLSHDGPLRLELYGIRAISTVARGTFGLRHRVPPARDNRGPRYLRVVAPALAQAGDDRGRVWPYSLRIALL